MDSSKLDAAYLDEIEPFTEELSGIVRDMQVLLATETRILEGTEDLTREEIVIPPPEDPEAVLRELTGQNELSGGETKECQWSNASANGCWTTGHTHDCIREFATSASTAAPSSLSYPMAQSSEVSLPVWTNSSEAKSDSCGCGTDATSESCACMEQTINVPTVGMPSEEK
jgi:hypothetical protein